MEQAYSEMLDLIQNQAEAFQIKLSEFGFNDYEKYQNRNKKKEI